MSDKRFYLSRKALLLSLFLLSQFFLFPQAVLEKVIQIEAEHEALRWKKTCIESLQRTLIEPYKSEYRNIEAERAQLGKQLRSLKSSEEYKKALGEDSILVQRLKKIRDYYHLDI